MGNKENNSVTPAMKIRYYGVRGSIPTPLLPHYIEKKIKYLIVQILKNEKFRGLNLKEIFDRIPFYLKSTYGGNSPCILVEAHEDTLILDAGSGIRELGLDLMKKEFGRGKGRAKIFFTHTHWDHIQGLPFFTPLFIPGNLIEFYSCIPDLEQRLRAQHKSVYFPIDMDYMQAEKKFYMLEQNKSNDFDEFKIQTMKLNHPGDSYAFRIETGGKTFIHSTDVEFNDKNYEQMFETIEFFKDGDILNFDSQYTLEESFNKIDWGHSSIQIGIDIANHSNIKKVVLFHYDPTYSDQKIHQIVKIGRSYKNTVYPDSDIEIIPSYEGLELVL
jgi:phosphoribosyl 1,2-cyclic phosphodiesterase